MGRKLKYRSVHYDQDEDSYGFGTLEKFLRRNEEQLANKQKKPRKRRRPVGRPPRRKEGSGRKIANRYAVIDPNSYDIVRFFDNIFQLQNYTGLKSLYARVHKYENYKIDGSPLIDGFIVVRWTDKDVIGMDRDAFEEFVYNKVRGWMIINQFDRIRKNITRIDQDTLNKLFRYLDKVEQVNSQKLLEDEEID